MPLIHCGGRISLENVAIATIVNGDTAYIFYNSRSRYMQFDTSLTDAEDMTNHPYKLRPNDYDPDGLTGVWVEKPGYGSPDVWNGAQIVTGSIASTNWTTDEGSAYDLDNEWVKLGGSNVTAAGAAAGIFAGLDSGSYKAYIGDGSNKYIKFDAVDIYINLTNLIINSNDQTIKLGTGNDIVTLDAADATYRLAIGHATLASASFRVTKAGVLTAAGANISGAITGATIDIGGADETSFHVDVDGNMWAGAATYNIGTNPFAVSSAGLIRAVSGSIAGLTLDTTEGLYAGTGATRVQMKPGVGIWTGHDDVASSLNYLNVDGSGWLADGNITWTAAGLPTITLPNGGNITIAPNGDIILQAETGSADSNRSTIEWQLNSKSIYLRSDYDGSNLSLYPSNTDEDCSFIVGMDYGGISESNFAQFKDIAMFAASAIVLMSDTDFITKKSWLSLQNAVTGSTRSAQLGVSYGANLFDVVSGSITVSIDSTKVPTVTIIGDIIIADDSWIGLGSAAGRIEFDDQATDEINFLDCNVGIGTSAPETLLELSSTVPYITIQNTTEEDGDYGREGEIRFKGEQSGGEETTLGIIQFAHDGASDDQKGIMTIKINNGDDGDSPTSVVTIDSAGKVGIGTISPEWPLHIKSSAPWLLFEDTDDSQKWRVGGSGGKLYFYDLIDSRTVMVMDGDGNVGIGTSTPSAYADLTLEGGALCIKERTTPTANADYGKIYTKSDNKLYFQDGAGTEHEIQFV